MGLKDKILESEDGELKNQRREHPNESRPQSTFSEMCECEHPNVPDYSAGYAASICTTCGGKVYLDG